MEWSIRNLLNPVVTRLLIFGVNPIDVEYVLNAVENTKHMNTASMARAWFTQWDNKAQKYIRKARHAESEQRHQTARELFLLATRCYYAITLINFPDARDKQNAYLEFAALYRKQLSLSSHQSERLMVRLHDGSHIPAYLHLPSERAAQPHPCVVIYSGLGSCKEEMRTLALPLIERGIAVFVADMPGNGETIYFANVTCSYARLNSAFREVLNTLCARPDIDHRRIGVYGLCMGGGYAYHAATLDARYKACVTFFLLFITQVDEAVTPQWMRQGEAFKTQIGDMSPAVFLSEMKALERGTIACPFLFIHGVHDNWMTLEAASAFYNRASGPKEKVIIEDTPVFSNQGSITHAMPVGEQLHWLRHVAADWMVKQLANPPGNETCGK
ncbi:MAG: alpha/beta hydrolase [Deltaproteobacteria bacterium]|nr:alpha/beta hydrolase [Deltaproteobacteria bacterium]